MGGRSLISAPFHGFCKTDELFVVNFHHSTSENGSTVVRKCPETLQILYSISLSYVITDRELIFNAQSTTKVIIIRATVITDVQLCSLECIKLCHKFSTADSFAPKIRWAWHWAAFKYNQQCGNALPSFHTNFLITKVIANMWTSFRDVLKQWIVCNGYWKNKTPHVPPPTIEKNTPPKFSVEEKKKKVTLCRITFCQHYFHAHIFPYCFKNGDRNTQFKNMKYEHLFIRTGQHNIIIWHLYHTVFVLCEK